LVIKDGLLKHRFEAVDGLSSYWQVIMPTSLRNEFIYLTHGGMTGGHFDRRRTTAAIQSRAYWPFWRSDMEKFLKQCVPCARYHRQERLQPTLVGEPWKKCQCKKYYRTTSAICAPKSVHTVCVIFRSGMRPFL